MFSRGRQILKFLKPQDEWNKDPYHCIATNEINKADSSEDVDSLFFVCCCTEIDINGECKRKDNKRPNIGKKVKDIISSPSDDQPTDVMYALP